MKKELLGKLQARSAAMRYRHPGKGIRIIVVAGEYGKTTTALLLSELLQEANQSVVALTSQGCFFNGDAINYSFDTSAKATQRCLAFARRKSVNAVIIEATPAFMKTHVLSTLTIEMSVIMSESESARAVLDHPANYMVVPSGFDTQGLRVVAHQAISYGQDEIAEARIAKVTQYRLGTEVELVIDHQTTLLLSTHLVGKANAYNLAAAVAASYVLATDIGSLEEGAARRERVAGNYDVIGEDRSYSIAVDAAHSDESLDLVLESANHLKKRRLLLVLDSSVGQHGRDVAKRYGDRVVVVGEGDNETGVTIVPTLEEAVEVTLRGAKKDDSVLLIGQELAELDSEGKTKAHRMVEATSE